MPKPSHARLRRLRTWSAATSKFSIASSTGLPKSAVCLIRFLRASPIHEALYHRKLCVATHSLRVQFRIAFSFEPPCRDRASHRHFTRREPPAANLFCAGPLLWYSLTLGGERV